MFCFRLIIRKDLKDKYYMGWCKGTVFFYFPGKDCGHSLTRFQKNLYFFFSGNREKKNTLVFFFSQKKITCHSLNFSGRAYIKKQGAKLCFFKNAIFNYILRCIFFFQDLYFFSLYFFFLEKIKLHSLTRFKPLYFFFRHRKKKYTVFTHSLEFERKCHKSNLFRK